MSASWKNRRKFPVPQSVEKFFHIAPKYAKLEIIWHRPCESGAFEWALSDMPCLFLLSPGEAELLALFFGRSRAWPRGLARFSPSLEQILFWPSLPTSYWWLHNGCCVPLLSNSAFSNSTCWIGEFLRGTEGSSFVLRHALHFHF